MPGISITHLKRIKHLARYFGILGFLCLLGYGYTGYSYYFLAVLGPPFFLAYWLRTYGVRVTSMIPNEPLYNNLLLLFATLIYFGLMGFQLKNILNERGKLRWLLLLIFFGFLFHIHRLSFKELDLYWSGAVQPAPAKHLSADPPKSPPPPSADRGPVPDLTLGDDQG